MATLAKPTHDVVRAMQSLGLEAWIPSPSRHAQIHTVVRPDEVRMTRVLSSGAVLRDESSGDDAGVARLLRTLGTGPVATAPRPRPRTRTRTVSSSGGRLPAPPATSLGALLCGLGLLCLGALLATGRR